MRGVEGASTELSALLAALREFRDMQLSGDPSDRALARVAEVSPTTIGSWLSGKHFPQNVDQILKMVRAISAEAAARSVPDPDGTIAVLLDEQLWRRGYQKQARRLAGKVSDGVKRAQALGSLAAPSAGRLLAEVTDPFALEVHYPVQAEDSLRDLPELPPYLRREHDEELGKVTQAAANGKSRIAVMVGGSSTGKTRACWEALGVLRMENEPWRLWHPIDPTHPEAALRDLPSIGPRTVVWLNEAQLYLDVLSEGLGERVAAGMRELLRDPSRAPVLILATMWETFWGKLTVRPGAGAADPHAQARELLTGRDISVPPALTAPEIEQLAKSGDPRLIQAAALAVDGHAIQFLAGAPELLSRYRNGEPAARSLINAAMDARRMGMDAAIPLAFLEAAVPCYLSDAEREVLDDDDWLERALAYTATPCKGVRGPLTRSRSRSGGGPAAGTTYRLADYLDQYGRRAHDHIPLLDFWTSAVLWADSDDLRKLAKAAEDRGLLRQAAQLRKRAAEGGDARDAADLIRILSAARLDAGIPAWDAAEHVALDDPASIAYLIDELRIAGAGEQLTALIDRDPAANVYLDDADDLFNACGLLGALQRAKAAGQTAALAERIAANGDLDNPSDLSDLIDGLRAVGAEKQIGVLLARDPAAHAAVGDPPGAIFLIDSLCEIGAQDQASALADRLKTHLGLHDAHAQATLAKALCETGTKERAAVLLTRDLVAHGAVDDPRFAADLIGALDHAGSKELTSVVLSRDPARHVSLGDTPGTIQLLHALIRAKAAEQVSVLLARVPAAHLANEPLDTWLMNSLLKAGADEHVAALLARRPAERIRLSNGWSVARLLDFLRCAGATEEIAVLLARDPARHVNLNDLHGVARLLDAFRTAGAVDQASVLADRAAEHAIPDSSWGAGELLEALRKLGATDQAGTLSNRLPAAGRFDAFLKQGDNREVYLFGREPDGTPSAPWDWDDLS